MNRATDAQLGDLPLDVGDCGQGVVDLHHRLVDAGHLEALPPDPTRFTDITRDAVRGFQQQRKLRAEGVCDRSTWQALVESGYRLGDRLLYLQQPMMRGDDVEELQRRLGSLGFDAGRVDGIFGPDTADALTEFQRNTAIVVDGIGGRETLAALARIGGRAGTQTVAGVRDSEHFRRRGHAGLADLRIVIGDLDGQRGLCEAVARLLRLDDATTAVLIHPDESEQARQSNDFGANLFLGFELDDDELCRIAYFSVPGFDSFPGRHLSRLLATDLQATAQFTESEIDGMRLPVLRETKMPAVVIRIGPARLVVEHRQLVADAVATAVRRWSQGEGTESRGFPIP